MKRATHADIEALTRHLMDEGKIIEVGFAGFSLAAIPTNAPTVQLGEMRNAFFAGAMHLFSSIITGLDPEHEVTDADERRMENINAELNAFGDELRLRVARARGHG